jgi:hypothetical protein
MGRVCSTNGRDMHKEFWWENLKERLLGWLRWENITDLKKKKAAGLDSSCPE